MANNDKTKLYEEILMAGNIYKILNIFQMDL